MVDEHWDADMLMGTTGPAVDDGGADAVKQDPMLWGRAGHLTPEQVECYVSRNVEWKPFCVLFRSLLLFVGHDTYQRAHFTGTSYQVRSSEYEFFFFPFHRASFAMTDASLLI